MIDRARERVFTLLLIAALGGCAGNGEGLDSGGRPLSEGGGSGGLSADFNSIQANVLTPICTACHAGATAPQGLRLDSANSYDLLVGVPSSEVASLLRVKAGDPDNSYLIQKLEGRAAVGAQMPLGGPPLPATTIAFIRQWITDGATRPVAAAVSGPQMLAIATTSPPDGALLESAPPYLVVAVTHELNASRVDAASLKLERLDGSFADESARFVAADIAVPASNRQTMIVTPRAALTTGHYRIVVSRSDGNVIQSVDGVPLSGLPIDARGDQIVADFVVQEPR
jgi:hypothetical protein